MSAPSHTTFVTPARRSSALAPGSVGRLLLGSFAGWAITGGVLAAFLVDGAAPDADLLGWDSALLPTVLYVTLWALLTPALLLATRQVQFTRPALSPRNFVGGGALVGAIGSAALLHLLGYATLAPWLSGAGSVVDLSDAALFYIGRFRENALVATVLTVAQHAMRHRDRLRQRELEAARLSAELSQSQLHALNMELHPHFLFNTLNAIAGMVWEDPARADAMVLQLSDLLRRTLRGGAAPTSTLADERQVLDLYLAIQQVRFGPRLTVTVDIPHELGSAEVPRFLIQPMVENAFQHGLAPKRGPVSLEVAARREGDRLVVRVTDDGVGIPDAGTLVESTGVGNLRRRLSALHRDDYVFTLTRRPQGGTAVTIAFPWRS